MHCLYELVRFRSTNMNTPKNHAPTKRRNLTKWMQSRQRRLFWKNKNQPSRWIAERINDLGRQIVLANTQDQTVSPKL